MAYYSRKLNDTQTQCTTTERELLSIMETLKEYRKILLGQPIIVHTDHKNLVYKHFNTERVMRWRLVLEEFGPELHYIKGENNVVADALSHLDKTQTKQCLRTVLPTIPNLATLELQTYQGRTGKGQNSTEETERAQGRTPQESLPPLRSVLRTDCQQG